MNTIKKMTLAVGLSMLTSLASASPPASTDAPDISGVYKCNYNDPASTPPHGTENIVFKKSGDTFTVKMIATGDTLPYDYGTALFNKDVNDAFTYVFWKVKDSTSFGAEYFIIKDDGSLDGVFLGNGGTKIGTETCMKSA